MLEAVCNISTATKIYQTDIADSLDRLKLVRRVNDGDQNVDLLGSQSLIEIFLGKPVSILLRRKCFYWSLVRRRPGY